MVVVVSLAIAVVWLWLPRWLWLWLWLWPWESAGWSNRNIGLWERIFVSLACRRQTTTYTEQLTLTKPAMTSKPEDCRILSSRHVCLYFRFSRFVSVHVSTILTVWLFPSCCLYVAGHVASIRAGRVGGLLSGSWVDFRIILICGCGIFASQVRKRVNDFYCFSSVQYYIAPLHPLYWLMYSCIVRRILLFLMTHDDLIDIDEHTNTFSIMFTHNHLFSPNALTRLITLPLNKKYNITSHTLLFRHVTS